MDFQSGLIPWILDVISFLFECGGNQMPLKEKRCAFQTMEYASVLVLQNKKKNKFKDKNGGTPYVEKQ